MLLLIMVKGNKMLWAKLYDYAKEQGKPVGSQHSMEK